MYENTFLWYSRMVKKLYLCQWINNNSEPAFLRFIKKVALKKKKKKKKKKVALTHLILKIT